MAGEPTAAAKAAAKAMADQARALVKEAMAKAVEAGQSDGNFVKTFEEIVQKNGWIGGRGGDTAEGRAWRARLLYNKYLRQHYAQARYKQMNSAFTRRRRPYWKYVHAMFREPLQPRPLHLAWDGMVLSCDDPWWKTNYPPNGYWCSCGVEPITAAQLAELGKDGPDEAPELNLREVTNPVTGEVEMVPAGVDPGFVGLGED